MIARIENMTRMYAKHGNALVAFSPETGEECSANPADYWMLDREFLKDSSGAAMLLGIVQRTILEVEDA